ncbi:ABC transporter ATP-binding protein [Streptomyces sp. NPDC057580]|uniref:ABC transporter ATP-binding protein n=1 Tax=Streptomyces sp. NPDC057580 TaxID=3346173 RepID=UPI00369E5D01
MTDSALLEVRDLTVHFKVRAGGMRRSTAVRAVNGVSLDLRSGETLGLVGESGSGKSTTARALLRLVRPSAGEVRLKGELISQLSDKEFRRIRKDMQMVFQDPYSSLDPSMLVADSVAEPLEVHLGLSGAQRDRRVAELLGMVGLSSQHGHRYPHEFSGGQRQRIAIARAIAVNPEIVLCDEAVSALDVSTQNQIINLLEDLRDSLGMSYLFISHDLSVVRHLAHRVVVMYLGQIVESGPVERLFGSPMHPYSQALLSAVPIPNPPLQRTKERILLRGDLPDLRAVPSGCVFRTRCPIATDHCAAVVPEPVVVAGGGTVACHFAGPRETAASARPEPVDAGRET